MIVRRHVILSRYFEHDDGSLPEIEVTFSDPSRVSAAFAHLYACGARDVTPGGGCLCIRAEQIERPFAGPDDAALVANGIADPFHVVLASVTGKDSPIPDLGVLVFTNSLTLDYRMGQDWGANEVRSLVSLLVQLQALGGNVSVPWWETDGQRDFQAALLGA